ncbi:hypothetical protein RhiirA4_467758 [Rhizophagus irregularis]|uniref:Uncharacterized protein n=1 Tax=Rhizophagus irregularis TaxID=588596 RepID=A0A2I1GWF9_9GLOM|nr:hypothetical protein RhiirA4_467758 [Rhizophagus irregularis]
MEFQLPCMETFNKIKDLIYILTSTMLIDPDPSTQHDGKRLKNINLTENEWQEISKLIIILEDFEYLDGINDSNVENINLTNSDTAFDDDVGYEDAPEDESISEQPKRRKLILIRHKIAPILKNVLKLHFIDQ